MEAGDYYQYNLTIKLGSLLSLPAKFLHRLRRIDDVLSHDLDQHPSTLEMPLATYTSLGGASHVAMPPPSRSSFAYEIISMPGPLAFMTSGYALGLLVMVRLSCTHHQATSHFIIVTSGPTSEQDSAHRRATSTIHGVQDHSQPAFRLPRSLLRSLSC